MRRIRIKIFILIILACAIFLFIAKERFENRQLQKVIERLTAESRAAEVLVTDVKTNSMTGQTLTTIKFLEYDTKQKPLTPKYFTFSGNIIQFQSLVIRFDDFYIKGGHPLKGKSAYIFMMAFTLNDKKPEIFEINKMNEVPSGYRIEGVSSDFQKKLWARFWEYALEPKEAKRMGIKNAQIEAPGTKFIKGILYTLKIEHDGGLRIDAQPLPKILNGEKLEF